MVDSSPQSPPGLNPRVGAAIHTGLTLITITRQTDFTPALLFALALALIITMAIGLGTGRFRAGRGAATSTATSTAGTATSTTGG